ncbi:MAG: hypothetical protein DRJ10_11835 [Bacteroidetes bacterium]|nr:MAG: hypothetical protein DRJ10_11835 [Bacteroidota bacterium]
MVLRFFKGFQPANLILIVLITIIFWFKVFFDSTNSGLFISENALPLYQLIVELFSYINSSFLNKLIALILVFIQAFLVTAISNQYSLIGHRSYMPILLFVLIILNFDNSLQIQAIYFANILFLIAWIKIKKAQGKQQAMSNYFDASLLIGLASLFYFNFIYLVLILWANILISRPGSFKEFSMALFGTLTTWYLFLSLYFIAYGNTYNVLNLFSFTLSFSDIAQLPTSVQIAGSFFVLLIFIANLTLFKYYVSLNINIRNNLKLFFSLFILTVLINLFTNSSTELIYIIAVPACLFLSLFFINLKSKLLGNILFVIMFIITIGNLLFADKII